MATDERELTEPTFLCTPDGRRLSPAARGFSRRPLLTANVSGPWGRVKRWDYWGILAGDHVVSLTYADVDYLGIVGVWWCHIPTGRVGGRETAVPLARDVDLPDLPGAIPLRYDGTGLSVRVTDTDAGTEIAAQWVERDGSPGELDVIAARPEGHEALHVVIPWSETRFQYTIKDQARPVTGHAVLGGDRRELSSDGDAWGVLDVGRGRWPYRIRWNWAGGAGRTDTGEIVGLQLGGKWTEGTGATENAVLVDGRLTKIGQELRWDYDWDAPLRPWRATAPDGSVDVVLTPRYDKRTKLEAGVMGMHVHQVFGTWSGSVRTDDGETLTFERIQGFAEEARNRW